MIISYITKEESAVKLMLAGWFVELLTEVQNLTSQPNQNIAGPASYEASVSSVGIQLGKTFDK